METFSEIGGQIQRRGGQTEQEVEVVWRKPETAGSGRQETEGQRGGDL